MNQTVEMYFQKLIETRKIHPARHSICDDPGQFVNFRRKQFLFALLQLADDAEATVARFVLEKDRLIFSYAGKRPLTITNPATERMDLERGVLGDINALTGLDLFTTTKDNKIGKVNAGLKMIFQFAFSFEVYDPAIFFRVDQMGIPKVLTTDTPGRKPSYTRIIIPLGEGELPHNLAYNIVKRTLQHLYYPNLFLTHLRDIAYKIDDEHIGSYNKLVLHTLELDAQTRVKKIRLICQSDNYPADETDLWVFKRHSNEGTCAVGFLVDAAGNLQPIVRNAFCFFLTKTNTGLQFLIQAPFHLDTDVYQILDHDPHNEILLQTLTQLAADAMQGFKQIENEVNERVLTDTVFSVIPLEKDEMTSGLFSQWQPRFYESIHQSFMTQKIIPTKSGYVDRAHAYWAANSAMLTLFDDAQLRRLFDKSDVGWIYPTQGYEEIKKDSVNQALYGYLDSLTTLKVPEESLIKGHYADAGKRIRDFIGVTVKFIEAQKDTWLIKFYRWLLEKSQYWETAKTKPIFLDQNRHAVAAYNIRTRRPGIFVPHSGARNTQPLPVINMGLADASSTQELLDHFGIRTYTKKDYMEFIILPGLDKSKDIDCENFKAVFNYYWECSKQERYFFLMKLKYHKFLIARNYKEHPFYNQKATHVYYLPDSVSGLPNYEEKDNFGNLLHYVDTPRYIKAVGKDNKQKLWIFLEELGVEKRKERIKSNPQSGGKPPIPPHADDILKQIYLSQKMLKRCPFDNYSLYEKIGYVKRNDGYEKKVKVLSCPLCHKSFMQNNSVPRELYDRDYDVKLSKIIEHSDSNGTQGNSSNNVINPIESGSKPGYQIGLMKFKTLIISHNPYVQCIAGHKTMKRSEIQYDCRNGSNKTLKVRICRTCHRVYLEKKEIPADIDFTALNVHLLNMATAKKIIDHVISLDTLNQKMEELESEGKRIFSPEQGTGIVIKNGIPLKGTTNRKETVIAVKFLEDLDKIRYFRENVAFKNHDLIFY